MRFQLPLVASLASLFLLGSLCTAPAADKSLDIYWLDVEGGAATLIVTPDQESVLIDSGSAGGRDSGRIRDAAVKAAGLKQIDYFLLTHFHTDHFGGIPELAQMMPVGVVYDKGIPDTDPDHNPNDTRFPLLIKPYREMKVAERRLIHPGDVLPLRQSGVTPTPLKLRCLGVNQQFIAAPANAFATADCASAKTKGKDISDNANSVVILLEFGAFRLFAAGDLTWDVEAHLACPVNLVGPVDVYQVTHHGLGISNNPLLVGVLTPTVAIMSNGTRKGCDPETFATLSTLPSLQASYQIHRNLRSDTGNNTAPEYIANLEKECAGNYIKLSVAADGKSYTVSIPATGHERKFATRKPHAQ